MQEFDVEQAACGEEHEHDVEAQEHDSEQRVYTKELAMAQAAAMAQEHASAAELGPHVAREHLVAKEVEIDVV